MTRPALRSIAFDNSEVDSDTQYDNFNYRKFDGASKIQRYHIFYLKSHHRVTKLVIVVKSTGVFIVIACQILGAGECYIFPI